MWRHGDVETWGRGDLGTWGHGDVGMRLIVLGRVLRFWEVKMRGVFIIG